jgi:hypothetical protein
VTFEGLAHLALVGILSRFSLPTDLSRSSRATPGGRIGAMHQAAKGTPPSRRPTVTRRLTEPERRFPEIKSSFERRFMAGSGPRNGAERRSFPTDHLRA